MVDEKEKKEMLPVEVRAQMLSKETSLYFNLAKFEHAQRIANLFSSSTMVPQHFQGNTANCLIALNYADRLQADPFMVMQNMYIVHGRPGVEAKLVIALINQSGKYSEPLKFRFDGAGEDYGCTAWTREAKSAELVEGPKVTWKMVKAEGWDTKNGTKWKTIPDLMFRYRAASWFANVHCPELKLGMQTVEEIHDFVELQETNNGKWTAPQAPKEEAPETWSENFSSLIENKDFDLFIAATQQANRSSRNEVVRAANANPDGFIAAFDMWLKNKTTKVGPQEKPKRHRRTKEEIEAAKQQPPADDEIPNTLHPDSDIPGQEASGDLNPEQAEREAVVSEIIKIYDSKPGYVMQAQKNLQFTIGRGNMPPSLDGCRLLLDEVHRLMAERGEK
jgi:hypothetical protein